MNEMKLIMENWRGYAVKAALEVLYPALAFYKFRGGLNEPQPQPQPT